MNYLQILIQLIIGLGLLNVWLLRFNKSTNYRGGDARNMKEEFAVYGLPEYTVYIIGFFKVSLAALLILGIWYESLVVSSAIALILFMCAAVGFHIKARDSFKKTSPSLLLLLLPLLMLFFIPLLLLLLLRIQHSLLYGPQA